MITLFGKGRMLICKIKKMYLKEKWNIFIFLFKCLFFENGHFSKLRKNYYIYIVLFRKYVRFWIRINLRSRRGRRRIIISRRGRRLLRRWLRLRIKLRRRWRWRWRLRWRWGRRFKRKWVRLIRQRRRWIKIAWR